MTHEAFNIQSAKDMPSLANQGGSNIIKASNDIPLLQEALTAGVQMVYRDPFVTSDSATPVADRMGAQIVFKGSHADMNYQAAYGYAGQESGKTPFGTPNDQIGGQIAWEWNLPFVTPKVELSRFTSNIDGDPSRTRTIASQQRLSLNWTIPNWPDLALTYGRKQTDVFTRPEGPLSDAIASEFLKANVGFQHERGKGMWSSFYKTSKSEYWESGTEEEFGSSINATVHLLEPLDLTPKWGFTRRTNSMNTLFSDRFFANLGTTYRMTSTLTFKPGFEFTRNINRFDALRTDTLSAKLGYSYRAMDDSVGVSILGQYILTEHSNTHVNPQTYDVSFLVKKDIRDVLHLAHSQQSLSLKIAHNQQVNAFSSPTPSAQTSAMLLVSIIP